MERETDGGEKELRRGAARDLASKGHAFTFCFADSPDAGRKGTSLPSRALDAVRGLIIAELLPPVLPDCGREPEREDDVDDVDDDVEGRWRP